MTHADAENAATAESAGESGGTADGGRERRARTPGAAPRRRAEDHQAEALKREVFGIATLAVALCMFLALASFDPADLLPNGPAVDTGRTANLIGPVGASVADILLRIFGLAAFLLPLTLGVPGVFFLVGRRVEVKTIDAVGYPVLVLCGAMLAHLLMSGMLVFGHAAGGLIGSTGAEVLRSLFGATGAYIIIYAVLALTFVLTTRISLVSAARHIARPAENGDDEPSAPRGLRGLRRRAADRLTVWRVARAEKRRAQAEEKAAARAARAARVAKETTGAEDTDVPDATVKAQGRKAAKVGKRAPRETETANAEGSGAFSMGDKSSVVVSSEAFRLGETGAAGSGPRIVATRKSTEAFKAVPAPLHDAELADGDWSASDSAEVVATDDGRFAGSGEDDDEFLDDAELDDPLDRVALSGRTDTVLAQALPASNRFDRPAPSRPQPRSDRPAPAGAPRLQGSVPAAPGVSPIGPVVMPRKSGPRVEQLEIPLPPAGPIGAYDLPPLNLLDFNDPEQVEIPAEFLREQADRLIRALETYKIQGRVTEIHPGPVVTMFEFEPAPGVRISKIASLADDLAMAMKALKVRIVAPIPGKGVVGFEVPNQQRETVWLKEIIGDERFHSKKNILPIALGKGIDGTPEVADLAKMPHLLVAGTTGSGKSVGVNGMITSLLYHAGPDEVRFIMVDPKMLELSIYEGIPHLLLPVVTDPKKAAAALRWACDEMDRRYELMKNAGVRDIRGFNAKIEALVPGVAVESPEVSLEEMLAASDAEHDGAGGEPFDGVPVAARGWEQAFEDKPTKLPFIVVVIDEFADLMMVAGKEVEFCVARIAQKARAAGIHLILATQRPSTDVITGVIKANFPTRIAFQVSSAIDSRTILSCNGAENLLGKGDMLFMPPGTGRLKRVHGAFVSEEEIHKVVEFVRTQGEPQYMDESVLRTEEEGDDEDGADSGDLDPMYDECVRVVCRDGRASTSHLQRRLSLGYNRAARIIDQMEKDGLVGPGDGAKPRQINKRVMAELIARWDGDSAMVN